MTLEFQQEAIEASSSTVQAHRPAKPSLPWATIADLAQAYERQEAEIQGMKNWMLQKATYDRSVNETLSAKLDQTSLYVGLDPATTPPMLPFPDELTRAWTVEEPLYKEEEEEDNE